MTDESQSSCERKIANVAVSVAETKPGGPPEIVVACKGCFNICFADRVADIKGSLEDIDAVHSIAQHHQAELPERRNTEAAWQNILESVGKPKMPTEIAAEHRRMKENSRPRALHVTRPDVESDRYRGKRVKNIDPGDYL